MRKPLLFLILFLFPAGSAWAQDNEYPKAEFYLGFSYLSADFGFDRKDLQGAQFSISGNFHPNVGIVADFGGQFKDLGTMTLQNYQFMAGPRFTARNDTATSFLHILGGSNHIRIGALSDTGIAFGVGGGVDINVGRRAAFRLVQIDYIRNRFGGVWFNDARYSIGLVIKWGGR